MQRSVSLSDTVGFIRDLPHGLVEAFQATLQEAVDADLLLHVVDASNETFPEQMDQVRKVLGEIGALDFPQILVFNKLDALPDGRKPVQLQDTYDVDGVAVPRVFVSARSGEGLTQLRQMLESGSPVGRKADFLIQEFNREANTIGSKCQNADIAKVVVDLKSEIEKIREQIQNIE